MIKLSSNKVRSPLASTNPISGLDLSGAYRLAVLLTGGTALAEEAVIRAIESINLDAVTSDELFERTIVAATELTFSSDGSGFRSDEAEILPLELQNVALLPGKLRHLFVLRVLLSMSRDSSARLLDLEASAVDPTAGLAAQMLVGLASLRNRVN